MYQPLTGRARRVMQGAHQEALRFNHKRVGTEHLLLALAVEGRGVGANVLRHLEVDLRQLRLEIETLMGVGPEFVSLSTRLPQTTHAANAIQFATQEAGYLVHKYVGTEHILLGLLREDEGLAAQILAGHALQLHAVRQQVVKLLESGVRRGMPFRHSAPREIEDLPAQLNADLSGTNAEISRMNSEKEQAIRAADFEKAAFLRDEADKIRRRRKAMIADWRACYPLDTSWLSWDGGAALRLAQRIKDGWRWDALPELASVLEQAGCKDIEMLDHCRQAGEHSSQCWVVDLLLARAT